MFITIFPVGGKIQYIYNKLISFRILLLLFIFSFFYCITKFIFCLLLGKIYLYNTLFGNFV